MFRGLLLVILFTSCSYTYACIEPRIGDPTWQYDQSKNDSRFPDIQEWIKAGVIGGVPCKEDSLKVGIKTASSDFQEEIDKSYEVIQKKGLSHGYLLIENGTHYIDSPINLKSGVILRGESKENTKLIVRIKNRYDEGISRIWAFNFDGVNNAGVENLTIKYEVKDKDGISYQPLDRNNYDEKNFNTPWPFKNNLKVSRNEKNGEKSKLDKGLFVGFIRFKGETKNSWAQDLVLLESGTNPIWIAPDSSHITLRGNDIYRCYNKGGNGNCYYGINGDYNLITNERVRKIRHVAIQKGAQYNVLFKNDFEVDVNFHNGDEGSNLVESNQIRIPFIHKWPVISTGGVKKHLPPGAGNLIYKNITDHKRKKYNSIPSSRLLYTLNDYSAPPKFKGLDKWKYLPKYETLYPMKHKLQSQ